MAEMKPFTINAVATLKIGETEWVKKIEMALPISMKFDGKSSVGTISLDKDGFLGHAAALADWFADFPSDEPTDG